MKRVSRLFLLWVLAVVLFLVATAAGAAVLVARVPSIQSVVVVRAEGVLELLLKTEVHIGSVDMALPAHAELGNIVIYDYRNQPFIQLKALRIDALSFANLVFSDAKKPAKINIRSIQLDAPTFHLYRRADSTWNYMFLIDAFSSKEPKPATSSEGPYIAIRQLGIQNGVFTYRDSTDSRIGLRYSRPQFNYINMRFAGIHADIGVEILRSGDLRADVRDLGTSVDNTGFFVDRLQMRLTTGSQPVVFQGKNAQPIPYVELKDVRIASGESEINGAIRFNNATLNDIIEGNITTPYTGIFAPSVVNLAVLNPFFSEDLPTVGNVFAQGHFEGDFHAIHAPLLARYGKETLLNADVRLTNLEGYEDLEFDIDLGKSRLSTLDLQEMLPAYDLSETVRKMRMLNFTGSFKGIADDFRTTANVLTDAGNLDIDMTMQLPPLVPDYTYNAHIRTQNLNMNDLGLGEVLPAKVLNFEGDIVGQGFDMETAKTRFSMDIHHSDLFGFAIDTLHTDSLNIADKKLSGKFMAKDAQNGSANLFLNLNYGTFPYQYIAKGKVKNIDLKKYDLYDQPYQISSTLDVNLTGDSLDNINGGATLLNTTLLHPDGKQKLNISDVELTASSNKGTKYVVLNSSLADADIAGNFTIGQLGNLLGDFGKEVGLYLSNNDSLTKAYYAAKHARLDSVPQIPVKMEVAVSTNKEINEVFQFLGQPVALAQQSLLVGKIQIGSSQHLDFSFSADSLTYSGVRLRKTKADFDLNKSLFGNDLLVVSHAEVDSLYPSSGMLLERTFADFETRDNTHTEFTLRTRQLRENNRLLLAVQTEMQPNGNLQLHIDPSVSRLLLRQLPGATTSDPMAYEWLFSKENRVLIDTAGDIHVQGLVLQANGKPDALTVEGDVAASDSATLKMRLDGLNLSLLNAFISDSTYRFQGKMAINASASGLLGKPAFHVNSHVSAFTLNDFLYGDVQLLGDYDDTERLRVEGVLSRQMNPKISPQFDTLLHLSGFYDTQSAKNPLNFTLKSETKVPLDFITPFVTGYVYGVKGDVALNTFEISGALDAPIIKGDGHIINGGLGVDYFKTAYTFDTKFHFNEDRISIDAVKLYDKDKNYANFYGTILHKGMQDFRFDLQMDKISNFLLIDTERKDNEYFYGKVLIKEGIASVTGSIDKLTVDAYMTTGAGTALKIPLTSAESGGKPAYITFAEKKDSSGVKFKTNTEGFTLNLTIKATPDAQVELVFDEKVGDIIRGSGNGNINMLINEQGDFSMFGDYEITKGDYLFTARNVVNKKFDVKSGGKIKWNGDPYDAQIKMEAAYSVRADIKDLLPSDQRSSSTTRIPTDILMSLEGSLMQPKIGLAIGLPNLNQDQLIEMVPQLKAIQYDEQELNKQVFSVMVFNRFAPIGGFSTEGVVSTSVTELISNQFNYWLSQALNDKVNVALNSNSLQNVNMMVSAKLFNDRVTVERDGAVVAGNNTPLTLGNISVLIRLAPTEKTPTRPGTRPAEIVLEVFNREMRNNIQQNSYRTGAGVYYKRDFDKVYEFLGVSEEEMRARRKLRRAK